MKATRGRPDEIDRTARQVRIGSVTTPTHALSSTTQMYSGRRYLTACGKKLFNTKDDAYMTTRSVTCVVCLSLRARNEGR